MYITFSCKSDCYNPWETYGYMHCVMCGCCLKDKAARYQNRTDLFKRLKVEPEIIDLLDDDETIRFTQEAENKKNIEWCEEKIRYYKDKLKKLKNEVSK